MTGVQTCALPIYPVALRPPVARPQGTDEPVRVLFLGRYIEAKGVFELLRAFALAQQQVPRLRLLLGGEGDRAPLLRLADELGVADKVELLGWVTGEAKEGWLDGCDIFALPSHFEALPVSMLEAMAAGQAVLMSNVGSIPEVVRHGENGWLVPPREVEPLAQALMVLGRDPALRRRLGARARADVEQHYASERVCEQLATLYDEVRDGP